MPKRTKVSYEEHFQFPPKALCKGNFRTVCRYCGNSIACAEGISSNLRTHLKVRLLRGQDTHGQSLGSKTIYMNTYTYIIGKSEGKASEF